MMDWEKVARRYRKKPVVDPTSATATVVGYGRGEIERLIPHRAPFLLIDAIESVDLKEKTISGRRLMDPKDPVFAGHFPGYPVYPGVLQVEMIGQLAVCFYVFQRAGTVDIDVAGGELAVRAVKIDHALFQQELLPGDEAQIHGKVLEADDFMFRGVGQVIGPGGKVCTVVVAEFFIVEPSEITG